MRNGTEKDIANITSAGGNSTEGRNVTVLGHAIAGIKIGIVGWYTLKNKNCIFSLIPYVSKGNDICSFIPVVDRIDPVLEAEIVTVNAVRIRDILVRGATGEENVKEINCINSCL